MRLHGLTGAVLLVASGTALAQAPPTFATSTVLREVAVSATDEQGRPVLGLEAADFDVREAGQRRPVQSVIFWSAAGAPDVDHHVQEVEPLRTPAGPMTNQHAERGRLIVLLLDDMLTSPRRTHAVRRAVDELVTRHVRADDQVAVITTSGRLDIDSGFLTDRRTMLARTGRFAGTATEAMTGGFVAALSVRRTMEIVGSLALMSSGTGGRPLNVVLFSEGVEFDIYNQRDMNTSDVNQAMRQAVDRIRASNLVLYAVDPRGLVTLEDGRTERNTYAEESDFRSGVAAAMRQATLARSLQSLRHLAEETGGFAATDRNEFKDAFARMQRETSALYLLAFEPVVQERGRDERIDVRVRRRGVRVAARQRVTAVSSAERDTTIAALLARPVSSGVLQLAAQVLRSRGVDASQLLDVAIVEWQPRTAAAKVDGPQTVELGLATVDDSGVARMLARAEVSGLDDADVRRRADAFGVRWLHEFSAATDDHRELRLAVRSDGAVGTLVVPTRAGVRLRIDDIAVASLERSGAVTAGQAPSLSYMQYAPTTARSFTASDVLVIRVKACGGGDDQPFELALIADPDRTRTSRLEPIHSLAATCRVLAARMPLGGFPPGAHLLQVRPAGVTGDVLGTIRVTVQEAGPSSVMKHEASVIKH
jgi:VWFA-related protein